MPVTQRTIVTAINTPGGIVYEWRDERAKAIRDRGRVKSPVNKKGNAMHRGGVTGTYRRMWRWERGRASTVVLRAVIRNRADHATYVEFGRRMSREYQKFSWTRWDDQIRYIGKPPKNIWAGLPKSASKRGMAFKARIDAWAKAAMTDHSLPTPWGGRKTAARPGKHILRNAINWEMVPWGFSRLS